MPSGIWGKRAWCVSLSEAHELTQNIASEFPKLRVFVAVYKCHRTVVKLCRKNIALFDIKMCRFYPELCGIGHNSKPVFMHRQRKHRLIVSVIDKIGQIWQAGCVGGIGNELAAGGKMHYFLHKRQRARVVLKNHEIGVYLRGFIKALFIALHGHQQIALGVFAYFFGVVKKPQTAIFAHLFNQHIRLFPDQHGRVGINKHIARLELPERLQNVVGLPEPVASAPRLIEYVAVSGIKCGLLQIPARFADAARYPAKPCRKAQQSLTEAEVWGGIGEERGGHLWGKYREDFWGFVSAKIDVSLTVIFFLYNYYLGYLLFIFLNAF